MLNIYAARENIDKERFIYDNIEGETLVIVPDQYTLVAEEQALGYLDTDCLFDTEILSMNRLGLRLLAEKGLESVRMLDKYGRFMLLGRLIKEHAEDFDIFRRSAGKMSFTSMLNDFIQEFKQQNLTLADVEALLGDEDADPLLGAKLRELSSVIEAYEDAIKGKYTDSEDYIAMYVDCIRDSGFIQNKNIWIYGYDSITPKFTDAVMELAKRARSVSFMLSRSDFGLDEAVVRMLGHTADERGLEASVEEIGPSYEIPKSETVKRIERGLFSGPGTGTGAASGRDRENFEPEDLTLVCAANPYHEAESAASYIWHLVRDLGYRMRDIQVIANDEGMMHPVIRRVFSEYGLPVFMDSARAITDTAPVAFIVNLLRFAGKNHHAADLFAMLKTGFSGIDEAVTEELENYARNYHIRGSMWERPFRYGEDVLGSEIFGAIEAARQEIMEKTGKLSDLMKSTTTGEFVPLFKDYLRDVWLMDDLMEDAASDEEDAGLADEASRSLQSYQKALDILDQIVEIMGDASFDHKEFTDIYVSGLANVEVGVIPPSVDGLSVGTMIRTRPRPVRAAVILGANEGTLPLNPSPEGLFSVDEKEYFKKKGFKLGQADDIRQSEENAAMYRMLSKPSEKIYISWTQVDTEGNDLSPSPLIDSLKTLFPVLSEPGRISKDVVSGLWESGDLICYPDETLRHLTGRLREGSGSDRDPLTRALLKWYSNERKNELDAMISALSYDNSPKPLGRERAARAFGRADGTLILSASSISAYYDCPFKFYVDRGLKPKEEREFRGDSRSVGDAYHECLMRIARRLISDRALLARASCDDEILEAMLEEELDKIASTYRGGLFISAGSEVFRLERIREICSMAARAMAKQLSGKSVTDAKLEEGFGRKYTFSPIHLRIGEDDVYVEGKIDRADILDVGGSERVRIIDYKTGSDTLDLDKMRKGYKMQLMIYMISASSGEREPAGMFYFNIKDPIEAADGKSKNQLAGIEERDPEDIFKLKGRYINEEGVLGAMPADVLAPKRSEKDRSMSREEYEEVRSDVLKQIEKTADGILKGTIDIMPLKDGNRLVCGFCRYRSICRRDKEYPRNRSREIE